MSHNDLTQGCVLDSTYADKFYKELSPVWLNYVAAINGAAAHNLNQPFSYLELGCGFGQSTMINAASFLHAEFHACDLNPQHISHAKNLAGEFGIHNVKFHEISFENLLDLELPKFDFIVLHGVYSWVNSAVRETLCDIINKKLKMDGLVYVSYNCLPGWAAEIPLRKLLWELALTQTGNAAQRSQKALSLIQTFSKTMRYFTEIPSLMEDLEFYLKASGSYLAHEFLNQAWDTFYSIDVMDDMSKINLEYLGSAILPDNHPMLVIDNETSEKINSLTTERQQQLVLDFTVNKRFRRDVFVRRSKKLTEAEIAQNVKNTIIGCVTDLKNLSTKVQVPRGMINFNEAFIDQLRILMAKGSMDIETITAELSDGNRNEIEIIRNLIFLVAAGSLAPYAKASTINAMTSPPHITTTTENILAHVLKNNVARALPSEILGNGILLEPLQALVFACWLAQPEEPDNLQKNIHNIADHDKNIHPQIKEMILNESVVKDNVCEFYHNLLPALIRLRLVI